MAKKPLDKDYWQTCPTTVADGLRVTGKTHVLLDVCAKDATAAKAATFISEKENSLAVDWMDFIWDDTADGVIWCNPPFSLKAEFLAKCYEVSSTNKVPVLALVPAQLTTNWFFETVVFKAHTVYIPRGRIRFINPETGEIQPQPREETCLVYFSGKKLGPDHTMSIKFYERTPETLDVKP